jgi:predicted MFS family arabinose efflux permease
MSIDLSAANSASTRLPFVTYVLAIGTFLMGTTEFIIAGLLPEIARDLDVSPARAGLLITVFAIGMIVGTPSMAILTLRLPRRTALILALCVFAAGHVIVAMGSGFVLLLAARFLTALATGAFWAIAAVVASRAAGPVASSRALGVVLGGGMLANVIGVPLGAFAGQLIGWCGPFWVLAGLAAVAVVLILRFVPHDDSEQSRPSVRSEFASLRSRQLWLTLISATMIMGGTLSTYSYIAPLLTNRAGMPGNLLPVALVGFGVGALIGSFLGGRLGDTRPYATTITAAAATAAILLAISVLSQQMWPTVILVALLGLTSMTVNPILIALAVRFAKQAPTLASALSTSAFNLGTAVGSWMAGRALESPLRELGPPIIGTTVATLTLIPLAALALSIGPGLGRSRTGPRRHARRSRAGGCARTHELEQAPGAHHQIPSAGSNFGTQHNGSSNHDHHTRYRRTGEATGRETGPQTPYPDEAGHRCCRSWRIGHSRVRSIRPRNRVVHGVIGPTDGDAGGGGQVQRSGQLLHQ